MEEGGGDKMENNGNHSTSNQVEILKDLRKITGLNQRMMAESLGIPLRTWEDWESGRRKMPDYLLRLINYKVRLQYHSSNKEHQVRIIFDCDGNKIVLINDLRFKGRKNVDWNMVEEYLKEYIGECEEIIDTDDMIYIGKDFPDEFVHSKDTKTLKGANLYAKANSSIAIKQMIRIATNRSFAENYANKHKKETSPM